MNTPIGPALAFYIRHALTTDALMALAADAPKDTKFDRGSNLTADEWRRFDEVMTMASNEIVRWLTEIRRASLAALEPVATKASQDGDKTVKQAWYAQYNVRSVKRSKLLESSKDKTAYFGHQITPRSDGRVVLCSYFLIPTGLAEMDVIERVRVATAGLPVLDDPSLRSTFDSSVVLDVVELGEKVRLESLCERTRDVMARLAHAWSQVFQCTR